MGLFGKLKRGVSKAGKGFLKQSPKIFTGVIATGGFLKQAAPVIGLGVGAYTGDAKSGAAASRGIKQFGGSIQKVGGTGLAASMLLKDKKTAKRKILNAVGKELGRRVQAGAEKRLRTMYDKQTDPPVNRNVAGFMNT